MKKKDIKHHLKPYSIYSKRQTTINHAFASAIAPSDEFDDNKMNKALLFLGQDPEDLKCVFCDADAETWDHLVGLVKKGALRGYGHQIGNLVPCCKQCNSKKGSKEFDEFIKGYDKIHEIDKSRLIELLKKYQKEFAKEIDLDLLKGKAPDAYDTFFKIKEEIFSLMKEADVIAKTLRKNVLR